MMLRRPAAQPVRGVSTVEAVAELLRGRILDGVLAPGTHLREVELAAAHGVGRHSVRAALQSLAHERLVRHEPNRGVFVPVLGAADVADVYRLRAALELEAIHLVLADARPLPAAAGDAVEEMASLGPDARWGDVLSAHSRFHRALVGAAASPRLASAHAALDGELRLCLVQLRPHYSSGSELAVEHRELLAALAAATPAAGVRLLRDHMNDALVTLAAASGRGV